MMMPPIRNPDSTKKSSTPQTPNVSSSRGACHTGKKTSPACAASTSDTATKRTRSSPKTRSACACGSGGTARSIARCGVATARTSALDVAVTDEDADARRLEVALQRFHERHRAMPAARAADGDRQVALAFVLVARKREVEQRVDVPQELARVVAVHDEVGYGLIEPGLRPQLVDEE